MKNYWVKLGEVSFNTEEMINFLESKGYHTKVVSVYENVTEYHHRVEQHDFEILIAYTSADNLKFSDESQHISDYRDYEIDKVFRKELKAKLLWQ